MSKYGFIGSALILMIACVPPATKPGVKYYPGSTPLILVNKGADPVCDVRLAFPSGSNDLLVCSPTGVAPEFQTSSADVCKGPCLAPGESRSFSIEPGRYVLTAFVGEKIMSTPMTPIDAATEVWWNTSAAPPSANGHAIVAGPIAAEQGLQGPTFSGPCIPSGQQVVEGHDCCDGYEETRNDGATYCATQ
jgi:hypothetical protein